MLSERSNREDCGRNGGKRLHQHANLLCESSYMDSTEDCLVCGERRRRIVRKLLLLRIGALDGDVVEEDRWDDRGLRYRCDGLRDPGLSTDSNNVGAKGALI